MDNETGRITRRQSDAQILGSRRHTCYAILALIPALVPSFSKYRVVYFDQHSGILKQGSPDSSPNRTTCVCALRGARAVKKRFYLQHSAVYV